jgi:hypothetical protein
VLGVMRSIINDPSMDRESGYDSVIDILQAFFSPAE